MYAVAGVTGHTGGNVASSLLDQGKSVRVLVRNRQKGEPWQACGAEVSVADLLDSESLSRALDGVEGLYYLVPPNMKSSDLVIEYRRFIDALTNAIKFAPVGHIVFLSTWGAHLGDGPFPMHYEAERRLRSCGVPCTFLRASFFMENTLMMLSSIENNGLFPSFFSPERKLPMVAARDIGALAASKLIVGAGAAGIVELTGPAEYSMNDVAQTYERALGKPIRVLPVPLSGIADAVTHAGGSRAVADFYREMVEDFEAGKIGPENPDLIVRGKTPLGDFVQQVALQPQAYVV